MAIVKQTFTPDNVIMRDAMDGVIPFEQGNLIMQEAIAGSALMRTAKLEDMDGPTKEIGKYEGGLTGYWVGEGQIIQTTKPKWSKTNMVSNKVGTIVVCSREFKEYTMSDFFDAIRPQLAQALYRKIDAAAIAGIDNPFDKSIDAAATDARAIEGELNIENFDKAVAALNDEGYEPNGILSIIKNKTALRGMVRDENGLKTRVYEQGARSLLDGIPVINMDKEIDIKKGTIYIGDFDQILYGIPYDINYRLDESAQISSVVDQDGKPLNLFERELMALRVTMDFGMVILDDKAFAKIKAPTV